MAVLISYSSDTGKTWSSPVVVSDYDSKPNTLNPPDDCMPSIAVNSAGVVGVMWYDHRDSPDNTGYWPRFSASLDGGETFLPSVKVSEAPSSLAFVPSASSRSGNGKLAFSVAGVDEMQFNGGHTAGLTSSADGAFHPLWVDNRTGISQVWTAAVTVVSSSIATPLESSPALTNVTDRIALRLGRPIYEPAKHVIAFDARIENMSKEPLLGPIKLRFSSLSSRLGQISALKSDNRIVNGNAEWDFTNELKHGALKAGEWSGPKRLEFRLYVTPEAVRSLCIFCNLIDAEVMVLAP
ncbi:MAG TPA: sialidase family protein [Pyrinomonadaceae bacterium]